MKNLKVQSFLGAKDVSIELSRKTLIVGPNGSGKSSVQNAIRFALAGDSVRVKLKKDTKELISEGQKAAVIDIDGSQANILQSKVVYAGANIEPVPGFLLDMHSFSSAKQSERSAMLNDLDSSMSGEAITEAAKACGLNMAFVSEVLPLVAASLLDAEQAADRKAKALRAEWKGITGEVYGSEKALFWKPQVNHEAPVKLSALNDEIFKADTRLTELLFAINDEENRVAPLRAACEGLDVLEGEYKIADNVRSSLEVTAGKLFDKLAKANPFEELCSSLAAVAEGVSRGESHCPSCKTPLLVLPADSSVPHGVVLFADAAKAVAANKKAVADYERAQRGANTAGYESGKMFMRLSKMRDAKAKLDEIVGKMPKGFKLDEAKAEAESLREKKNAMYLTKQELTRDSALLEQAEKLVSRAATVAKQVGEWVAVAEFFSASGEAAALLGKPLEKLSKLLDSYSVTTKWKRVKVDSDFSITYGDRDYSLLSESEQWRVDAMIAAALVALYGKDVPVLLDRFDVLDLEGRGQLLDWVEQSPGQWLLFGTLKACPTLDGFNSYWIEKGISGL